MFQREMKQQTFQTGAESYLLLTCSKDQMVMFTKDASDRYVGTSARNCTLQKGLRFFVTRCRGSINLTAMHTLSED